MLRQVNSRIGEYIPLSNHRKSTKNHLEIGKAVLPIQEILQNYYSMESGERRKTLKTSFRLSHDILFHLRIFFFFDFIHGILRQTAIIVIIISSIYILVYIAYTDYTVYAFQYGW